MQGFPTILPSPTPTFALVVTGGVAGGLLLAGLLASIPASRRAAAAKAAAALPPASGSTSGDPGMRLWLPGWCDVQATNDEAFVTFLAGVSAEITGQWPPPTPRDDEVITETMRRAFPACPWPPTDPGWHFHGSKPDQTMTWPAFLASMSALLEAAWAEDLPWGPKPYSVR